MGVEYLSGLTLGQYDLREILGMGGMSAVYRGFQRNLNREVAIKILSANLVQQPGYIERFTREAKTAAGLEHPYIVPIHDYGTQQEISYVVMRLLPGGTLSQRMMQRTAEKQSLPSLGEVNGLLEKLAAALDYAHREGVVHRDIKPSNVMFDHHGVPYLVDFGIAKLIVETTSSGLTNSGLFVGTPTYMAPEQWMGMEVTPAADQYALGALTYLLVTGKVPFEAPTPYALMNKHLHELATPPHRERNLVPESVSHVLWKAMAKNSEERYANCTAFATAFTESIQGIQDETTLFFTFPMPRAPGMSSRTPATGTPRRIGGNSPTDIHNIETPSLGGIQSTFTPPLFATGPAPAPKPYYKNPLVWLIAILLGAIIGLAGLILTDEGQTRDDEAAGTRAALENTINALVVSGQMTNTPPSDSPTDAPTEAVTEQPTDDAEIIAGAPSQSPSPSPSASATREATNTPTATATGTVTFSARQAAQATLDFFQTATATHFTATPTENLDATIVFEITALFLEGQTQTATHWTNTPTATASSTHTPSRTPTPSQTPTPSNTPSPTTTPLAVGFASVNTNAAWTPVIQSFDGVEMVLVPAGCFSLGSEIGDSNERPVQEMCFDAPFWLDRTEVTQAAFAQFNGQADAPPLFRGDNRPRERVTWAEAWNFCQRRGMYLPSEAEWEYASRGPDGSTYPWGAEFDGTLLRYNDLTIPRTVEVGSFPAGASWVGAMDMSGNVWEWVNSIYRPYPYDASDGREANSDDESRRVVKGGSWNNPQLNVFRGAHRSFLIPSQAFENVGFRCARPYEVPPTAEDVVCLVSNDQVAINVRATPDTSARRVELMRNGQVAEVIAQQRGADGRVWQRVRFLLDGNRVTGWVRADLLTPVTACVAVQ